MTIYYHPRFSRSFRRLDPRTRVQAEARIAIFRDEPFDIRLKTHHLHGKLKKQLSFSVNSRIRILFEFFDEECHEAVFLDIGDHDIYK
jgi:mRNA-degrading endonuclease YafQ of YafQ-DinJ toxin-antitoxin module